jgi:hypothetical protein
MDTLNHYRSLLKQAICSSPYYVYGSASPDVETLFICDENQDCYVLMDVGWRDKQHVCNTILLTRIKDGKIRIEEDWTEEGIATDLLRAGVPKEDIVLAFQHPSTRAYTDFAVA